MLALLVAVPDIPAPPSVLHCMPRMIIKRTWSLIAAGTPTVRSWASRAATPWSVPVLELQEKVRPEATGHLHLVEQLAPAGGLPRHWRFPLLLHQFLPERVSGWQQQRRFACLKERQLRSAREVIVIVRDCKTVRNFFLFLRFFLQGRGLTRPKIRPHTPQHAGVHPGGKHLQLFLLLCDLPLRIFVVILVSDANLSDNLL